MTGDIEFVSGYHTGAWLALGAAVFVARKAGASEEVMQALEELGEQIRKAKHTFALQVEATAETRTGNP